MIYNEICLSLDSHSLYYLLSNCNPHKYPGPDNVHNYILRETTVEVAPLLTHLFQQTLCHFAR